MQRVFLSLILVVVLLLYSPVLSVYFSHDDFFHFKASQTDGTLGAFINLFSFEPIGERGYAFYRPIFREGLFNISYSLFGLDHLPLRIISLVIHSINIILVYRLISEIFRDKRLALFTAFFFGTSSANVGSLYYLAGGIQSLGVTMFVLASAIAFVSNKFVLSFIFFLLALGSHELAIMAPFLIGILAIIKKIPLVRTWPFWVASFIFAFIDFAYIGFSQGEEQYNLEFSVKSIVNSFGWYWLWALGVPEMFIDFVGPRFSLNPNLMKFWGEYVSGIFLFFGITIAVILGSTLAVFRKTITRRVDLLMLLWFPIALSPVILLPLHKSTYYLNISLFAFWAFIGILIFSFYNFVRKRNLKIAGFLLGVFLSSAFCLSVSSVLLADKTYPAANRGRIAQILVNEVRSKYPQLPKGAVVYFQNDPNYPKIGGDWGGSSKQAHFALNGSDALQLVYRDPTLRVVYEDLDNQTPPDAYTLVARIN